MTKPTWYRALSLAGLAGLCCFSCAEHPVTPLSEAFDRWHIEESQPLGTNRVDVLWVVDNSSSMLDEQAQLGREFASFVDALSLLGADVHLAAVSTDISEGGTFRRGPGDVIAKGCFSPPDDLATCGQRDPVLRTSDYKVDPNDPGSAIDAARLAADFRCLGQTGDCGEPIEMGLDAVRLALSPESLAGPNQGFLRDDAYLVVIVLSDEDDCSQNGASTSGGDSACYAASRTLPGVDLYLDALIRAKTRPGQDTSVPDERAEVLSRIFVAGIIGPDAGPLPENGRDHPLACTRETSEGSGASIETFLSTGYDGKRYRELIGYFGARGLEQNICAGEYASALTQIGDVIGRNLNLRCLQDPPLTCQTDAECPAGEACVNPGDPTIPPKVCSGFEVAVALKNPEQPNFTALVSAGSAGESESLGSGDAAVPATAQYVVDYDATSCPNSIGFRFISPASVSEADKALVIPAPGAVYRANYAVPAAP